MVVSAVGVSKGIGQGVAEAAFCLMADGPVEGILAGLRQGTLLRQIIAQGERCAAALEQP